MSVYRGPTAIGQTVPEPKQVLAALLAAESATASAAAAQVSEDNAAASAAGVGASAAAAAASLAGMNKDGSGGVAGLTLFKLNMRNALNTVTSWFTNSNTAARTYTLQNRDGTLADDTDLALKAPNTRLITAGNGITGGGSLAADRTLTLATPGTTTPSSTNAVTAGGHTHALTLSGADILTKLGLSSLWADTGAGEVFNGAAVGYMRLPGNSGLTLQWGNSVLTTFADGAAAQAYPRPFTSVLGAWATSGDFAAAQIVWTNLNHASNTTSTLMLFGGNVSGGNIVPAASTPIRARWLAIGIS